MAQTRGQCRRGIFPKFAAEIAQRDQLPLSEETKLSYLAQRDLTYLLPLLEMVVVVAPSLALSHVPRRKYERIYERIYTSDVCLANTLHQKCRFECPPLTAPYTNSAYCV